MEELALLVESLISTLIGITILALLFSTGLGLTFGQVTVLWRKPGKLLKSLLAAVVLVPVVTYGVLYAASQMVDLPEEVLVGVMLMSAASGSALAIKLAGGVGADPADTTSLMMTLTITTIISAPVIVALTMPPSFNLSGADVALTLLKSVLLPLILGVAVRTWWVSLADIITEPLTKLSGSLMNVVIILIIVKDLDVILGFGLSALVVMVLLGVLYVLIGHILGGPGLPDRVSLGLNSVLRASAPAMIVAAQAMPAAISAIVGFGVVNMVVAVLYLGVITKRAEGSGEAAVKQTLEPS